MHHLRFRQIHLDFHTSPAIPGIGASFDRRAWQETLRKACVDSVTTFAKCHHGWSYHETRVGRMHPHLGFDLLHAQFEASKEIDVNVPIYISAGVDNVAAYAHPEWRQVGPTGQYCGWSNSPLQAGFHMVCFHSPYLDYLCEQAVEVVRLFPTCDGIFSDIIHQGPCCCRWCLDGMVAEGLNPEKEEDRAIWSEKGVEKYRQRFTAACRIDNSRMPVFHNSGHISRGRRDILEHFSHLELESLPTGGWGYDHFPISARYCLGLEHDFLGMTGKFHTTWGEFGGYKHPNALRYECAAMLAHGSKCSVGDQLHPNGVLDPSTYRLIGAAYSEVQAKEPWCDHVTPVADIAVLSYEANACGEKGISTRARATKDAPDVGAGRILLEGHFLFDVIDSQMDFARYKLLILPDAIEIDPALKVKLDAFLAQGGKLMLTGMSGLAADGKTFLFDVGARCEGLGPCQPDYILPMPVLRPEFVDSPIVMYSQNRRLKVTDGESLGAVYDSYFNRTWDHFCSHQHTPYKPEPSGYDLGVRKGNLLYIAHPVFSLYRGFGAVAYKDFVVKTLRWFLGEDETLRANLPSTARVTMMQQPGSKRSIVHLLYATTINRGGPVDLSGGTVSSSNKSFEVIEELLPLTDVSVTVRPPHAVTRVTLEPQGKEIPFTRQGDRLVLTVNRFTCHQMVVLHG